MNKVYIENHGGRLRLRWQYQGKRYGLSIGARDNASGWTNANLKKALIEKDLQNENFDPTLVKYKPQTIGKNRTEISIPELFERFTEQYFKDRRLSKQPLSQSSLERYQLLGKHLERSLTKKVRGEAKPLKAHELTEAIASNFVAVQLEHANNQTVRSRLWMLQACWDWAKGKYKIADTNPWSAYITKVKSNESKKVNPFSAIEVQAILNAFKHHQYYSHYYPLVAFLFCTGCRFGEAVGLRWRNVSDDFKSVLICQTISRGEHRNTTKTGKARAVNLTPNISNLLRSLSEKPHKPDDLVFRSPRGLPIDDHCFNRRAWHRVLGELEIEYRKPYCTRHTAISHALANGANPIDVAAATGHSTQTMLKSYASSINRKSVFVEF
ncbi:MAG: tyrosine-type recombinase/integrase [Pseudanabaenaceae cyanobacterium bins.68]|nr:tyrosine-type recombinase/integrase [Pseudanabaenaceae cyanobacterium bins.68]